MESRAVLIDTTGRVIGGDVVIELRPGIGIIGPNGEHLEGGPHTVPAAFAAPLLASHRARVIESTPVEGAPEGVVQRDPTAETREGRRPGKKP